MSGTATTFMKPSLQALCDSFITNRDVVQEAFKWDTSYIYPVCANIFCSHGRIATTDQLKQCRKVIDDNTGIFSNFRGNIRPILPAMLAIGDDPDAQMKQALENYALLKEEFWGSEYLSLVSFLLTNLTDSYTVREKAAHGKEIYKRMQKEHPFLTSSEDSVFAVLMAFSEKANDALISDMEAAYTALKERFSIGNEVQTVSHVLSMTNGNPVEKAQRVINLYNALHEAGIKYGHAHELSTLAALSLTEVDIPVLVEEIGQVDAFLKGQKGYGILGPGANQRAMHAAMIVSDQYTSHKDVNTAAMTSTITMIVAQEMALCMICCATT